MVCYTSSSLCILPYMTFTYHSFNSQLCLLGALRSETRERNETVVISALVDFLFSLGADIKKGSKSLIAVFFILHLHNSYYPICIAPIAALMQG